MRASGLSGELRYGYETAARLGTWAIESDGTAFRFSAVVTQAHELWALRRPLTLVLALGNFEWSWTGLDPAIAGARAEVVLTRRPDMTGPRQDVSAETAGGMK